MPGDHEQIYKTLLEHLTAMREDMGEMKSDIKSVKKLSEDTAQTVKRHDNVISNWQGRIAAIGAIVGVIGTTVISWIKRELNI